MWIAIVSKGASRSSPWTSRSMVATFSALIESGVISTLMVATCVLTAYFLVDTYLLREPTPKYTKDGTAFILRLKEPLDTGLAIKAGGTRLIQTIAVVKQQSDDLKTEITGRLTKDQTYRTDPVGAASGRDAVPR